MTTSLLTPGNVCLHVVDVQQSLMAKIDDAERVASTVDLMIRCARIFKMPILANTQYIKGLGPYAADLEELVQGIPRFDKVEFNALANEDTATFIGELPKTVTTIALVGVETHICIYQTAMGLLNLGLKVWIVADGVSSRKRADHEAGLARLQSVGGIIGPAEMLIYELLGRAGTAEFKQVLPLIINRSS
ncbi:MAG: isochorismatase family protein [Desulforhopalus sp.]|nr:isochorismatase family protein [Desulforhopalus sp.]